MSDRFLMWLFRVLPPRFALHGAIQVMVIATTGKYGNTIVPELPGMEAVVRFSRFHGLGGSGKDEHYDSNRNRK